jgi:hypothetical protein
MNGCEEVHERMGMCLEDVEAETEVEKDGPANGVNLESREAATIPHSW